jgi:DNA polymerase-3 subunit delta
MESNTFGDFKDKIEVASMFKEKKLIILENAFSNQDFIEKFLKYKKTFGNNIILFFEEGHIDTKNSLFKFLKKNAKLQEFSLFGGEKLKNWIKKEFQRCKVEISPVAIQTLINFVGNDLWQLSNEIEKLASFKGEGKKIKDEDVLLLVKPKIETGIFQTIDAIAERKKNKALTLIHQHLEKGDSPQYLLSMINFQFRNLLEIKDMVEKNRPYYVILKKSNLHPYVVKKSYQQAQKFSLSQLKKIYQRIFQVDLAIKTGKIMPELALDLLITEI